MEKEIPLSQIVLPTQELRFYRSPEFLRLLTNDIRKEGMLVLPIVTPISENQYELLDGVNRIKCAQKLKWETVKCTVLSEGKTDIDKVIYGLKVNIFRKSHDVMGIVRVFSYLKSKGMKQKDIAQRFGMSKGYVSQIISLTKLPIDKKNQVAKGQISLRDAYLIVRQRRDPSLMEKLNIQYKCDVCKSKVSFSERELVALCSECRSKLEKSLRQERDRQSHEREQKEL